MADENIKTEEKKEEKIVETPKTEEKTAIKKESVKKIEKKKRYSAVVNARDIHLSTKCSRDICRFIKGKTTEECIAYLEDVIRKKKAIPMKGEIPHRKGKMMSGRFPRNASIEFIKLLKSVAANANYHEVENPVISEAYANIASRPHGRFGRTRKKRSHITIKLKERKVQENKKPKEKTQKENKTENKEKKK